MNSEYVFCFCVCFNLGSSVFRSSMVCFRFFNDSSYMNFWDKILLHIFVFLFDLNYQRLCSCFPYLNNRYIYTFFENSQNTFWRFFFMYIFWKYVYSAIPHVYLYVLIILDPDFRNLSSWINFYFVQIICSSS